jgi:hypothetical protein
MMGSRDAQALQLSMVLLRYPQFLQFHKFGHLNRIQDNPGLLILHRILFCSQPGLPFNLPFMILLNHLEFDVLLVELSFSFVVELFLFLELEVCFYFLYF